MTDQTEPVSDCSPTPRQWVCRAERPFDVCSGPLGGFMPEHVRCGPAPSAVPSEGERQPEAQPADPVDGASTDDEVLIAGALGDSAALREAARRDALAMGEPMPPSGDDGIGMFSEPAPPPVPEPGPHDERYGLTDPRTGHTCEVEAFGPHGPCLACDQSPRCPECLHPWSTHAPEIKGAVHRCLASDGRISHLAEPVAVCRCLRSASVASLEWEQRFARPAPPAPTGERPPAAIVDDGEVILAREGDGYVLTVAINEAGDAVSHRLTADEVRSLLDVADAQSTHPVRPDDEIAYTIATTVTDDGRHEVVYESPAAVVAPSGAERRCRHCRMTFAACRDEVNTSEGESTCCDECRHPGPPAVSPSPPEAEPDPRARG